MPKGEFRPSISTLRWSATPSPVLSRSSVMRLALGPPAPARCITSPIAQPFRSVAWITRAGALVSATSTSPFGRTCNQRG